MSSGYNQWTRPLEMTLVSVAEAAEPGRRGFWMRLEQEWRARHPYQAATGKSLAKKYRSIVRGSNGETQVVKRICRYLICPFRRGEINDRSRSRDLRQ